MDEIEPGRELRPVRGTVEGALGLQVGDLTTDHSARIDRLSDLEEGPKLACRLDAVRGPCQPRERFGEKSVARQNADGLAEDDVCRLPAAPQIIVVERRKIVVDQRVRMDQLQRGEAS